MAQARQGSKKRSKTALHLWATAGTALAMAGSASAKAPTVQVPLQGAETRIHLAEQEISDVIAPSRAAHQSGAWERGRPRRMGIIASRRQETRAKDG